MSARDPSPTDADIEARYGYVHGRLWGGDGFVDAPEDRLATRVIHLHALTSTLTNHDNEEPECGFAACSEPVKNAVLGLVASLAEEIHELHEQIASKQMIEWAKAERDRGRP